MKKEEEAEKEKEEGGKPALDLGFKDGQTIKINMKITVGETIVFPYVILALTLSTDIPRFVKSCVLHDMVISEKYSLLYFTFC